MTKPIILTSGDSHFFGFHDLSPWNPITNEVVCLKTSLPETKVPCYGDTASVIIAHEDNPKELVIGETLAWNWQKGARTRWMPAYGSRVVLFNSASKNGFESQCIDLDSSEKQTFCTTLYDVYDSEQFGLTVDFVRLFQLSPGYGYELPNRKELFSYESDGIFFVDLAKNKVELLISISDFIKSQGIDTELGDHYFTHINISPNGSHFSFLHRCRLKSGGLINNLVVSDKFANNIKIICSDKVSHYDWQSNDTIIVWCRNNSVVKNIKESNFTYIARALYRLSRKIRINFIRQNLYKESFREINIHTGAKSEIGKNVLIEDGHPQVNPIYSHVWVNDTYPNPEGYQTLMLYNQVSNRRLDLLSLKTQPTIQETIWRCDFHPRWHPEGKKICFDSAHLGRRQVCILDVESLLEEFIQ